MDYLNGILSLLNQVQLVEEAIPTLCDRLLHATLANDRRAAVLGLKSFSREYRESVVEYGLKSLVLTLKKDIGNLVTVKAVLETLLILFIRGETDEDITRGWISQQSRVQNGKYPSPLLIEGVALDQFSMWISDALFQDPEVIRSLVDLLQDNENFHIRLYTLQLLEGLVSARSDGAKDCLKNIPTAISIIASLLDDVNEPVRNEAILLLMALTNNNDQIQQLVAFENTFEKLFNIIDEEGGIRGSILVQDCLTLITNLLQYNPINQKLFLETNIVPRLQSLINEPIAEDLEPEFSDSHEVFSPIIWSDQRILNLTIALEIVRTFVTEDNTSYLSNQNKLFDSTIFFTILKLVFSPLTTNEIKSAALLTTGDLIRGNPKLQFEFSQIDVPYIDPSSPTQNQNYDHPLPVPVALLNWALLISSVHSFEIRSCATYCLKCYFTDNNDSTSAFLSDQIKSYTDPEYFDHHENGSSFENGHGGHEIKQVNNTVSPPYANIFKTLMDYDASHKLNPYKVWFAAVILLYIIEVSDDNKEVARNVKTGDEEAGEEVMNSIQAISGLAVASLESFDHRVGMGYLMLLTRWLYGDLDAVNDFLGDVSIVRAIITFATNNTSEKYSLLQGMASILLGVAYEFSSKDSPLPRQKLHSLLTEVLGKDKYALKFRQFHDNELVKSFQEEDRYAKNTEFGLPNVFFDTIYLDLIKNNSTRIRRALHHDPLIEPRENITFEAFEDLDLKFKEVKNELLNEKLKAKENTKNYDVKINSLTESESKLNDEIALTKKKLDSLNEKHAKVSRDYEKVKSSLEVMTKSKNDFELSSQRLAKELSESSKVGSVTKDSLEIVEQKLEQAEKAKSKMEDGVNKMTRELFKLENQKLDSEKTIKELNKEISKFKNELLSSKKSADEKYSKLQKANTEIQKQIQALEAKLEHASTNHESSMIELREKLDDSEANNKHLMDKLRSAANAFQDMKNAKVELSKEVEDLRNLEEVHNSDTRKLKAIENELSEISAARNELSSKFDDLNKSSSQEILSLKSKLAGMLENESALKTDNEKLSSELNILKLNLLETKNEFEKFQTENSNILSTLKTELIKLKTEHEAKIDLLKKVQNDYEQTKSELERLKDSQTKEIRSISLTNERLEDEVATKNETIKKLESLDKQLKEKKDEHDVLKTKHDQLKIELNENSEKLKLASSKLLKFTENELSLKKSITALELERDDRGDELQKNEDTSRALKAEVLNLKNQHNILKEEKTATSAALVEIAGKLSELESSLKAKEEEYTELSEKHKNVLKLAADSKSKIRELELELLKSKSSLQVKESDLEKAKAFKSELEDSLDKVKLSNDLLSQELSSMTEYVKVLKVELKDLKSTHDLLNNQLLKKSDDLEKLEQELKALKLNLETTTKSKADLNKFLELNSSIILDLKKQLSEAQSFSITVQLKDDELVKENKALQQKIDDLTLEMTKSKKNATEKALELTNLKAKKDLSDKSLAENAAKLLELQKACLSFELSIETHLETISNLKIKNVALEEKVKNSAELSLSLDLKKIEVDALKVKITKFKEEIMTANNDFKAKEKEVAFLKKELEASQKLEEATKLKASLLSTKVQTLEGQIKSLKGDLQSKSQELELERAMLNENSETIIKEYSQKISQLESSLSKSKEETELAQKQLEESKDTHETQLSATKVKIKQIQTVCDTLERHERALKADLEKRNIECNESKHLVQSHETRLLEKDNAISVTEKAFLKAKDELISLRKLLKEGQDSFDKLLQANVKATEQSSLTLEKIKAENEDMKQKVKSLEKIIEDKTKLFEDSQIEAKQFKADLDKKMRELQIFEKTLSDLEDKLLIVHTQLEENKTAAEELKNIQQKYDVLNGQFDQQKEKIETSEKSRLKTLKELEVLLEENTTLRNGNDELSKLEKEYKKTFDENVSLKLKVEAIQKKIELEKASLEKCSKEKSELCTKLDAIKAKKENLSKDTEIHKAEIQKLKANLEETNKELEKLRKSASNNQQLEDEIKLLNVELDESKKSIESNANVKIELGKKVKEFEKFANRNDELEKKLTEKTNALLELKDKLEAKVVELTTNVEVITKEKVLQTKKISELEKAQRELLEQSKLEKITLDSSLEEYKSKEVILESELSELKKELSDLKSNKIDEDTTEVGALKKENHELKEKAKSLVDKADLNDLLLLLTSVDESKNKYKAQLKKLGEEVSSDESEDDSDEE